MVAPCCQPLGQEFGGLAMRQGESRLCGTESQLWCFMLLPPALLLRSCRYSRLWVFCNVLTDRGSCTAKQVLL
jgi:hypothetical protein